MKKLVLLISVFVFLLGMQSMLYAGDNVGQRIAKAQKRLVELRKELQVEKTSDSYSKEQAIRRLEKEIKDIDRYVKGLREQQKAKTVKVIESRLEVLSKQLDQVAKSDSCSKDLAEMRLKKEIQDLQSQLKRLGKK